VVKIIRNINTPFGHSAGFLFFERFIAQKVFTACSRASNKIVPLTNLNKHLYSGKSDTKVNINNTSEKSLNNTATFGELITTVCTAGKKVSRI
jgi:hypothetical protein